MKNYTITVNGNVYDVVVEEGASTGAPVARAAAPKAAAEKAVEKKTTAKTTAPKAEVKAEPKAKVEKKAVEMLKVTLVKSGSGRLENQIRTLKALGLNKTNSSNIVPDNAATRGMIFVVKHLVSVEKVK